jgi:hypothetical protein
LVQRGAGGVGGGEQHLQRGGDVRIRVADKRYAVHPYSLARARNMGQAGHLDLADAREMASWDHGGGFSLDASVRIEGHDRAGLERLEQFGNDELAYRFPKPQSDGRTDLRLTPLELIDQLAALIPPPRLHRHRYHGVLAPNSPQRPQVTALARPLPQSVMAIGSTAIQKNHQCT